VNRQEQPTSRVAKTAASGASSLSSLSLAGDDNDESVMGRRTTAPAPRLAIGSLVEGRLRILRILGRGGMSEVYEAQDERAGRTVAVKLMTSEECLDAKLAIFAEARSLLGFHHPNVVGFYGVGAVESQPFIELESVRGGSLSALVDIEGAIPAREALEVLVPLADAIASLHAAGIVHRDVKSDNVLLAEEGRPVIADFGLAMHAENLPALPRGIVGTPAYMAPEAILGITETFEQYAFADQYSFGVLAYHALTGTMPFQAATPSGLFYAQMAVEPDSLVSRCATVPEALDAIVIRALSKRPNDRFPTMAAMRDAMAAVRDTLPEVTGVRRLSRPSGVLQAKPSLQPTVVADPG
jgi:serine/threonine-protein kinase